MLDLFLGKAYFVVEKPRKRRVRPEPLRRSAQYGTAISRVSLASSEASFCVRICLSLEELILGAASVTQTVQGRMPILPGSIGQYKDCYQRYQDFFPFFLAIPPSKKI